MLFIMQFATESELYKTQRSKAWSVNSDRCISNSKGFQADQIFACDKTLILQEKQHNCHFRHILNKQRIQLKFLSV